MDKKLKIAIIGSRGYPYVYSGYETLVKELSERLTKKGHHVRVYCHSSLFIKKPKFVNGIELVYSPSVKSKIFSQLFNSFFSTLHFCFSSFDIGFYVNSANGPFGIITKLFGKKTCINVDGLEWLRPKWKGLGSIYFYFSSKLATIFFDEIITDSSEMKKIYNNRFNKDSSCIAYGSTMTNTKDKTILHKYDLEEKGYYLIVGRLIPDNNSSLICQGFLKSKSKKKIVIVGDVPYHDNYAEEIKKIDKKNIIFTGYVNSQNELTQLYKNSYCYLHGHEFGGTNPTMINALALNCNILALDTKFNKEMLDGTKNGFFKKNINSIKKSIQSFEKNYDERNEISYILPKKYDWDFIVIEYLKVFSSLKWNKIH